ncbi:MAG: DegV family protein [Bacillota bacterium]
MGAVRIVTDSTADLPRELAEQYGVVVVPLKVLFGQEVFRDGADLDAADFYSRLKKTPVLPTTSQPAPGEFVAVYERLTRRGDSVISIHISSALSGTFHSAQLAKTMVDSKDIFVIDSRSVSMGLGLIVIAAAKAAREGRTRKEILTLINDLINNIKVLFVVDSLEYLERGGRIGKASALLGSLLNIKPILALQDGLVTPLEKVRGKSRALDRLVELAGASYGPGRRLVCSIVHSDDYSSLMKLRDKIEVSLNSPDILISELGPVVGTHVGPGTVGIVVYPA